LLECLGEHDEVDGVALVVELNDALEDLLVGIVIEAVGADDLKNIADDAVVAEHGAEDGLLGLWALRGETLLEGLFGRHGRITSM
jgi:hypothetical protein